MTSKTHVDVTFTVTEGDRETMVFSALHITPHDLMAVCNKHASHILQQIREKEGSTKDELYENR